MSNLFANLVPVEQEAIGVTNPADPSLSMSLQHIGIYSDDSERKWPFSIELLHDIPHGIALQYLEQRADTRLRSRTIIVTSNMCPEYCDDVWDLKPSALLASSRYDGELGSSLDNVLSQIATGRRVRIAPVSTGALTYAERLVLRYTAQGCCNKHIADKLCLQEKTIRNSLSVIYEKLDIENRTQAALYYWGLLFMLRREEPPVQGSYTFPCHSALCDD